ncbi:hypothetical protein QZH41_015568 [Actinostola sp. cb2023]|nr:hypothetical protein QZH41_015568 [Actinostola sp. cb2023]
MVDWSIQERRKKVITRGDQASLHIQFHGFYLTRGHYSNNSSATIHDDLTGKTIAYAHRTKRGLGANWQGTSGGAEGDMFTQMLQELRTTFSITKCTMDNDSSCQDILLTYSPETEIIICGNHRAKSFHADLQNVKNTFVSLEYLLRRQYEFEKTKIERAKPENQKKNKYLKNKAENGSFLEAKIKLIQTSTMAFEIYTAILGLTLKKNRLIQSKLTNNVTSKRKQEVWEEITKAVNYLGVAPRLMVDVKEKWKSPHSKAKKELSEYRREQRKTGCGPAPKQMVELSPGQRIYVFESHMAKAAAKKSATATACFLLSSFFTEEELIGKSLTGRNDKESLDNDVIESILNPTFWKMSEGMCLEEIGDT